MKRKPILFAGMALIPAILGPLPAQARQLTVALCGGGALTIPAGGPTAPGQGNSPCCAKGCHTGQSRKRLDRSQ